MAPGQEESLGYLEEHFRLGDACDDPLDGVSLDRLPSIIADYRDLSVRMQEQYPLPRTKNDEQATLMSSGFQSHVPDTKLIRRSSLYFDKFYVDDPLVRLSRGPRDGEESIGKLLGAPVERDFPGRASRALAYIRELLPAVREGYVEFLPASIAFEPPKELLLSASDCFFEDSLPSHIMNWFWSRSRVRRAKKTEEGGWVGTLESTDEPCRAIWISYDGHEDVTRLLFLVDEELKKLSPDGHYKARMSFPDEPPNEARFHAWKYQSVNQVSADTYWRVLHDLYMAQQMRARYLAPTPFVADLLLMDLLPRVGGQAAASPTESKLLQVDLPVVDSADMGKLMRLRSECGEELEALRSFLAREVARLQTTEDPEAMDRELKRVSEHVTGKLVPQVEGNVRKLRQSLLLDGTVLLASLGAILPTQGLSLALLPVVVDAGVRGIRACRQYAEDVKSHPAYFLWRLTSSQR
jgi:hypothetical protein